MKDKKLTLSQFIEKAKKFIITANKLYNEHGKIIVPTKRSIVFVLEKSPTFTFETNDKDEFILLVQDDNKLRLAEVDLDRPIMKWDFDTQIQQDAISAVKYYMKYVVSNIEDMKNPELGLTISYEYLAELEKELNNED